MNYHNVLPDTTLAMIVKNERMNAAGGIKLFLDAHLPFFEDVVIFDTGSVDGTREILEDYQKIYRNLRVYDTEFVGFAEARNESLNKVKTRRAFVLDADELFCPRDFEKLYSLLNVDQSVNEYSFTFLKLRDEGGYLRNNFDYLVYRLFDVKGYSFENSAGCHFEDPVRDFENRFQTDLHIKHFDRVIPRPKNFYPDMLYLEPKVEEDFAGDGLDKVNFWRRYYPYPDQENVNRVLEKARFGPYDIDCFPFGLEHIRERDISYFAFPLELEEMLLKFKENHTTYNGRIAHEFNAWKRMVREYKKDREIILSHD